MSSLKPYTLIVITVYLLLCIVLSPTNVYLLINCMNLVLFLLTLYTIYYPFDEYIKETTDYKTLSNKALFIINNLFNWGGFYLITILLFECYGYSVSYVTSILKYYLCITKSFFLVGIIICPGELISFEILYNNTDKIHKMIFDSINGNDGLKVEAVEAVEQEKDEMFYKIKNDLDKAVNEASLNNDLTEENTTDNIVDCCG